MALTALVKDELARYETSKASVRKAEISTILRFTGGLHIVSGRIVVEAEVDSEQTALRMQQTIAEIYGHEAEITSVSGGGLRRGGRYIVRVDAGGEALARQTGLLDLRGRPVRGLPPAAGLPARLPFRYGHLRLLDGIDRLAHHRSHRLGVVLGIVQQGDGQIA